MECRDVAGRLAVGIWGAASGAAAEEGESGASDRCEVGLSGGRARERCEVEPLTGGARELGSVSDRRCEPSSQIGERCVGDCSWPVRERRAGGFTAAELLATLAVAGVLMSLAVPGFAGLTRSMGLSSAANELLSALHTARASAVLRGSPVAVCLTADDQTCIAAPHSAATGWLVFVASGTAAVSRPAVVGEVLMRFRLPDRLTVSASRPTVTFWPVTRAASTSTFDLCDVDGAGRSIVVSQTGRPRVSAEATSCA